MTGPITQLISRHGWGEPDIEPVFSFAGKDESYTSSGPDIATVPGATCGAEPFGAADVAEIIDAAEGENDESDWIVVGLLNDLRYFSIVAGCDYTGWG